MLDEPFASVDEPTRVQILQDVRNIISTLGMTVVLVTHDLAEAISLCDEVFIISRRPGTVYRHRQIPFGRSRNLLELRRDPTFLNLYGELWHDLSSQLT
jgi:NitT/TauT family transport system ATP-binding protein